MIHGFQIPANLLTPPREEMTTFEKQVMTGLLLGAYRHWDSVLAERETVPLWLPDFQELLDYARRAFKWE